ncbi:GntR family transcriptional regulator [Mycolicibacterium phlei]|jgi:DNA-binding GntR family transcriptional regulator
MRTSPQIRTGTASKRVADAIRAEIMSGELAPGDRIRQEEIAARYGASRIPVREALKILEADGLVTLKPNSGAWVARLSIEECEEIYRTRERIEPLLLRYSAPKLDSHDLEELRKLAVEMESTTDLDVFLRQDRAFHQLTYSRACTVVLGDMVQRLWNATQHYRRAFTTLLDERSKRIMHDEHHMLVEAIRDSDLDEAERVLSGHIKRTRLQLEKHPEVFSLPH